MKLHKLIKKIAVKVVLLTVLIVFVAQLTSSIEPIVNNYIAAEQLNNDDFSFVVMQLYNNFLRPFSEFVVSTALISVAALCAYDVYCYSKNKGDNL